MFGKTKTATVAELVPERRYVSLEAEALGRAKKAEARILEARAKLAAFNAKHFLSGDWGSLVISGMSREQLDREGHALLREHDDALTEFGSALSEWAQYKKK